MTTSDRPTTDLPRVHRTSGTTLGLAVFMSVMGVFLLVPIVARLL
jgi:hypothetical protein